MSIQEIPKILSIVNLDSNFEKCRSLKFINSLYAENIWLVKNELVKFNDIELQKLTNFIFDKIYSEHKTKKIYTYQLGELVFFLYHLKNNIDNTCMVLEEIKQININFNIKTIYSTVFWIQIEFMKIKIDEYKIDKSIDLDYLKKFCTLSKSIQFAFSRIEENKTINRANNTLEETYSSIDKELMKSYVQGSEDRNKHEKSKGGKARADKYKHAKDYVIMEYLSIIKKSPKMSNNQAVHMIIDKMDNECFNYSPLTKYSRIDTLRKWVAKVKKGEDL